MNASQRRSLGRAIFDLKSASSSVDRWNVCAEEGIEHLNSTQKTLMLQKLDDIRESLIYIAAAELIGDEK